MIDHISKLKTIVYKNPNLAEMLEKISLPEDTPWYLAAGCINQTAWNHLTGRDITYGIDDYDFVYWDDAYSREKEVALEKEMHEKFSHLKVKKIDVTNQAGVHTWFEKKFGKKIDPYDSLEHAISTWPATATCIGVTKIGDEIKITAPYGLEDIFSMVLRPNKPHAIERIYNKKAKKWKSKWPELKIIEY